jgi:hypothetical protein
MELDPEEAQEMANMQQRIKGFQNTDWSEKCVHSSTLPSTETISLTILTLSLLGLIRLAGALAGKAAGAPAAGSSEVVEMGDARAIKASGTSGSANANARKRKGR